MRRTKILATLGPASEQHSVLTEMVNNGLNAVRCNFSHGTAADHQARVELIRQVSKETGQNIGILGDLQGPKIRVARFKEGKIFLEKGATFIIDTDFDKEAGTETQVGTDYETLHKDLKAKDILLLDDGNISLVVSKVEGTRVITEVLDGGKLSNNKGINKKGGGLTAPALTDKDKEDIKTIAKCQMDYVAVSFPRDAADMNLARKLLKEAGSNAGLVAKVERVEAVANIDEIIEASDAIMVARGDLAVEIDPENVPRVQKHIIKRCRELNKAVITATQMMESMIEAPVPTRAEVSDVANAILDGTDTIMLSAETAAGKHPARVISVIDRVACAAETDPKPVTDWLHATTSVEQTDHAIAVAAMFTAKQTGADAIVTMTESGTTALWVSRVLSETPIFAITRNASTVGLATLWRGVVPILLDSTKTSKHSINREAIDLLLDKNHVKQGDRIILTSGDHQGVHGGTNKLKILEVGKE